MTCATAKLLSLFNRPGDLAAEDATALAAHRAECPDCASLGSSLTSQDAAIVTAMKAVAMPVGFKDALKNTALRTQGALARQFWLRSLATAAAVIVAGFTAIGGYALATRPTVDVESLLHSYDPTGGATGSADFERWRLAEGLPTLPEDFDLNLVCFTGELALEGRSVPAIRLRAGFHQEATVYFVRDSRFDLVNASDSVGSTGTVRVYANQPGGWTVIVLHTGTNLQPFLNRNGSN